MLLPKTFPKPKLAKPKIITYDTKGKHESRWQDNEEKQESWAEKGGKIRTKMARSISDNQCPKKWKLYSGQPQNGQCAGYQASAEWVQVIHRLGVGDYRERISRCIRWSQKIRAPASRAPCIFGVISGYCIIPIFWGLHNLFSVLLMT